MKRFFLSMGLCVGAVVSSSVLAGQFGAATHLNAGTSPRGLVVADLDGDGKAEIISANFGDSIVIGEKATSFEGSIVVFKNQVIHEILDAGTSPRGLATADLNNDGRLDIVAGFYTEGTVGVYLQQKDHHFSQGPVWPVGTNPVGIATAKINGQTVVAVANSGSNSVSLFKADAKGMLSAVSTIPVGEKPVGVALFVTASGNAQAISANFTSGSLSIVELDANLQPGSMREIKVGGSPSSVHLADLNGDHLDDLSTTLFHDNKVAISLQAGGTFDDVEKVKLTGLHPNSLTTLNVGGATMLAAANRDSDIIDIVGRDDDGDFAVLNSLKLDGGDDPSLGFAEVASGDVNGDGLSDIVSTHMRSGRVNMFLQNR